MTPWGWRIRDAKALPDEPDDWIALVDSYNSDHDDPEDRMDITIVRWDDD